jgi:hypothetical protein
MARELVRDTQKYVDRLTQLVDILEPLYEEASKTLPDITKFKRTTKLRDELRDELIRVFPPPPPKKKPQSTGVFTPIIGGTYTYIPDGNTYPAYKKYRGMDAYLLQIGRPLLLGLIDKVYYDSQFIGVCDYQIRIADQYHPGYAYIFWTRINCLRPKTKTSVTITEN